MFIKMHICRTCLTEDADKDVSDLADALDGETYSYSDIMLFCLGIRIQSDSKITSKLCMKCYLKIISYHKFKVLALKNDEYLRSIQLKEEVLSDLSDHDDHDARSEEMGYFGDLKLEVKHENNIEEIQTDDDELLSVIKKIKYENVNEDIKTDKENAFLKPIKKKLKKPKRNKELEPKAKVCDECGKTVRNLKDHMNLHKPEFVRKRYKCKDELCERMFSSYSARLRHYKVHHLGIKKKCTKCDKEVVCLKNHLLIVHNVEPHKFICPTCGRKFHLKATLDQHLLVHSKDRPFNCEQCEKSFKSNLTLLQHVRQVHDQERTHLCQFCSKSFFKKYHLQMHLRSHSKEKPHECPECGKFFATTSILNNHRTIHSDVKSFACDLCDMAFSRKGYLRTHMISHTKEKRHSCKYCGVRFGRSDHRLRHERTAHERHIRGAFDVFTETS